MNDAAAPRPNDPPTLYVLGVGGPVDAEGVGHVERFVWRFLVRETPGEPDAVLGFSTMRHLMAFTRTVNARRPQAVSTEAFRVSAACFEDATAPRAAVDLPAEAFDAWLGRGELVERVVPALEG